MESPKKKTFVHHDGTYHRVPDIEYDYAMCDEQSNKMVLFRTITTRNNITCVEYIHLLHGTQKDKPDFSILCPTQQCNDNNKKNIEILTGNEIQGLISSKITHHLLSSDKKWLALGLENNTVDLFSLDSFNIEYTFSLQSPLAILCAAHKSPLFAACCENGDVFLPTPTKKIPVIQTNMKKSFCAQFSPNDQLLIIYQGTTIYFLYFNQPIHQLLDEPIYHCEQRNTPHPIIKTTFTADGKLLIIAMANGKLDFYNTLTKKCISHYPTWSERIGISTEPPLMLCSLKNQLLISSDPNAHNDPDIRNFFIWKLSNGRLLSTYNFHDDDLGIPRAIGLATDENTIVFSHTDNKASVLHLYTEQDIQDFQFIENEANIYHLCELFQLCKKLKLDKALKTASGPSIFVNAIRTYIQDVRKSYSTSESVKKIIS